MFLAIDHMRQVRTRALSPDKTVSTTMTAEGGVRVDLALGCLSRHSVDTLAVQVRAAIAGVLEAYRRAGDQVMSRDLEPDALDEAWKSSAGRRLRPFMDALENLKATGVGPRGVAKVGMADERIRVAFRPEALTLRETDLSAEIEAALVGMYDHRSRQAVRLYDELVTPEETNA